MYYLGGLEIGPLLVKRRVSDEGNGQWECQCLCGDKLVMDTDELLTGVIPNAHVLCENDGSRVWNIRVGDEFGSKRVEDIHLDEKGKKLVIIHCSECDYTFARDYEYLRRNKTRLMCKCSPLFGERSLRNYIGLKLDDYIAEGIYTTTSGSTRVQARCTCGRHSDLLLHDFKSTSHKCNSAHGYTIADYIGHEHGEDKIVKGEYINDALYLVVRGKGGVERHELFTKFIREIGLKKDYTRANIGRYVGRKYDKLRIVDICYRQDQSIDVHALCDCGGEVKTKLSKLKAGEVTSCGCTKALEQFLSAPVIYW